MASTTVVYTKLSVSTHTHTHSQKNPKIIQILESAAANFKISIINTLKVLKKIWTEWENKQEITAEEWEAMFFLKKIR